ncbi:MAG: acetylglutamate kinase, partial [Deltaproteobacteria bacterium]
STLTAKEAEKLSSDRTVSGGMIPKLTCCLQAIKNGVGKTHIIDGRVEHALLLEVFTTEGIGTQIVLN